MIYTLLYFIIFLVAMVYCIKKKTNALGILLLSVYLAVGAFSTVAIILNYLDASEVEIIPYVYLLLCVFIFISPFLTSRECFHCKKVKCEVNNIYIAFLYGYIAVALITLYCYAPSILNRFKGGDWFANRKAFVEGGMAYPYSNLIEYAAMNIAGYFQLLAFVLSFMLLKMHRNRVLAYTAIALGSLVTVCGAIHTSARGSLVFLGIELLAMFIFVYPELMKKDKCIILGLGGAALLAVIPYMVSVTLSRFSDVKSSVALLKYMGQAPIIFNTRIFPISDLSYGEFGIGRLLGMAEYSKAAEAGLWITSFYTFVGWLYIDWGMVGVLAIGLIVSMLMMSIIQKKTYHFCDVYMIFFVYNTLTAGSLVIGRDHIYNIVITLFVYCFMRSFIDKEEYWSI